MVLGAIAKAAAKAGGKKEAKAKTASRARKAGDDAYNARRRYQRSAERNLKKAEQSSGATAARYRQLARTDLDKSMETYEQSTTQNFNKTITNLASELGVDLQQQRRRIQSMREGSARKLRDSAISEEKSRTRLVSNIEDDEARRQAEAREIMNSKVGSRIFGGLVDVWNKPGIDIEGDYAADEGKIYGALFDYFNVDNLADMLEKVEQIIGDKLYGDEDNDAMYQAVKIMLQKHVAINSVTQ